MGENPFGKTSKLSLTAIKKEEKTILEDVSFTAPYKIMQPFQKKDGAIEVMLLAASAGIMEGDRQEFDFWIRQGADLKFISQSYDKIHQMKKGCAKRQTKVVVEKEASFCFYPQPIIPFKDSAFEGAMKVYLEDETAEFCMSEIFSCGRYASGEKFQYRYYHNLIEIYRKNKLIYRDNVRYEPSSFDMQGMGMYEGYTHLSSMFVSRSKEEKEDSFNQHVCQFLKEKKLEGDITRLAHGDYVIRIFGRRAQELEKANQEILEYQKMFRHQ